MSTVAGPFSKRSTRALVAASSCSSPACARPAPALSHKPSAIIIVNSIFILMLALVFIDNLTPPARAAFRVYLWFRTRTKLGIAAHYGPPPDHGCEGIHNHPRREGC